MEWRLGYWKHLHNWCLIKERRLVLYIKQCKLKSIFIILCLLFSFICLEDIKTDNTILPVPSHHDASSELSSNCNIQEEDACTLDMLTRNQTINLRNQNQFNKKSYNRTTLSPFADSLCPGYKFYISVNSCIYNVNSVIADILHYIHNKDGKKRI